MNSFLTKAGALVLVCLNTSLIFGASSATTQPGGDVPPALVLDNGAPPTPKVVVPTPITNVTDVIASVVAAPSAPLPFQQCLQNYSDPMNIAASAGAMAVGLISANALGTLSEEYLSYLTLEALAAEARKNSASLGDLGRFLCDKTANDISLNTSSVYAAFQKITGQLTTASDDLSSIFASQAACTTFVATTVTSELPQLLKALGLENNPLAADISVLSTVVVPVISPLLYNSYNGLMKVGANVKAEAQVIDAKIKACCGCWPF